MRFLDLDFTVLSLHQVAEAIAARPPDAPFAYVVTPNADHLVRLSGQGRDKDGRVLLGIYQRAAICLLDSRVVALLCRLLRLKAPPVVTGSDLTEHLVSRHIAPNERVVIIGLSPVWLPALVARYRLAAPAHYDPPMGFDRDPAVLAEVVAFIKANPARLIFLATGSPRQEILADVLSRETGLTGTGLCIGASLEFLCGARTRAPKFLSRCSLEWAWRLALEPRRMARRYLIESPKVIGLLWRQRRMAARSRRILRA
ncbi:MAG TPA: WecB/TagA/CpsF family glycosyltransferase [Rhodopila sp.]|uniref:WecB/TagA/CpsF family glycosyltransferase n=1 Tax=Rhodopila sp. TaxID=2480087 RepID=UPI002BB77839|nr:WecB/TagA/CpsF family glycosyltransferase [Rhodopila sp.]HVY17899.1 WecB/TagA/CpsF family glycosyltransferase [Rhodopila sp.]